MAGQCGGNAFLQDFITTLLNSLLHYRTGLPNKVFVKCKWLVYTEPWHECTRLLDSGKSESQSIYSPWVLRWNWMYTVLYCISMFAGVDHYTGVTTALSFLLHSFVFVFSRKEQFSNRNTFLVGSWNVINTVRKSYTLAPCWSEDWW